MSARDTSPLLRPDLLDGVAVVLAHASPSAAAANGYSPGVAIAETCAGLGAHVLACPVSFDPQLEIDEDALEHEAHAVGERARASAAGVVMLAVDGASLFAHGRGHAHADDDRDAVAAGARRGLRACLDASWIVTRAVAAGAFLPNGQGGRIVYLAPSAVGEYADAARAGLENLARTLSIEWARHAITTVAIAPPGGARGAARGEVAVDERHGGETPRGAVAAGEAAAGAGAGEVAMLTAYLASPAGAYFSGCLLDLRGPAGASI
jgi:NAD(P)-dependent dehydrogenase (short-subunit alcohol dehydrogenase family)